MVPLLVLERALKMESAAPESARESCFSKPGLWVAVAMVAASIPLMVSALVLGRSTSLAKDQAAAPRDTMMMALFFFGAGLILFAAVTLASAFVFSKIHFKGSFAGAEFEVDLEAVHTMGELLGSMQRAVQEVGSSNQATARRLREALEAVLQALNSGEEPKPRGDDSLEVALRNDELLADMQARARAQEAAIQRLVELRDAASASDQQQIGIQRLLTEQAQLVNKMNRQLPALGRRQRRGGDAV